MTTLQHLEDLENEDKRLLAAVMLADDGAEEEWDEYFAGLAREHGVERETPERLAELHGDLGMLFDAGCDAKEASYVTKRSPYLTGRLEGDLN